MRKIVLTISILCLFLGLTGCTPKTSIEPKNISFTAFYIGQKTEFADEDKLTANLYESNLLKMYFKTDQWVKSTRSGKTIPVSGVVLFDQEGRTYFVSQIQNKMLIGIVEGTKDPVFYEGPNTLNTTIMPMLKLLEQGIRNKAFIKQALFKTADITIFEHNEVSEFDVSTQTSALKALMHIDDWVQTTIGTPYFYDYDIEITLDPDHVLRFRTSGTTADVAFQYEALGATVYDIYKFSYSDHEALKTALTTIKQTAYPAPGPQITDAVYTKGYLYFEGASGQNPDWVIGLSASESDQIKTILKTAHWNKITPKNPMISGYAQLTDTNGFVTLLGDTDDGPEAKVTSLNDPDFVEYYAVSPTFYVQLISLLGSFWETGTATTAMKNFVISKQIIVDYWDYGTATLLSRQMNVSTTQSAAIMAILKLDSWRVDVDPTKYATEIMPAYQFTDKAGHSYSVYNWPTDQSTAIRVEGLFPGYQADARIWFTAPISVFKDLQTYMNAHYPKD